MSDAKTPASDVDYGQVYNDEMAKRDSERSPLPEYTISIRRAHGYATEAVVRRILAEQQDQHPTPAATEADEFQSIVQRSCGLSELITNLRPLFDRLLGERDKLNEQLELTAEVIRLHGDILASRDDLAKSLDTERQRAESAERERDEWKRLTGVAAEAQSKAVAELCEARKEVAGLKAKEKWTVDRTPEGIRHRDLEMERLNDDLAASRAEVERLTTAVNENFVPRINPLYLLLRHDKQQWDVGTPWNCGMTPMEHILEAKTKRDAHAATKGESNG